MYSTGIWFKPYFKLIIHKRQSEVSSFLLILEDSAYIYTIETCVQV